MDDADRSSDRRPRPPYLGPARFAARLRGRFTPVTLRSPAAARTATGPTLRLSAPPTAALSRLLRPRFRHDASAWGDPSVNPFPEAAAPPTPPAPWSTGPRTGSAPAVSARRPSAPPLDPSSAPGQAAPRFADFYRSLREAGAELAGPPTHREEGPPSAPAAPRAGLMDQADRSPARLPGVRGAIPSPPPPSPTPPASDPTTGRAAGLIDRLERGGARVLGSPLRSFLEARLHLRFPPVRVLTDPAADELTRLFRADAVSFGPNLAFRSGAYRPDEPAGVALIGHELTHAAAATTPGRPDAHAEEDEALANERSLLAVLAAPAAAAAPPPSLATGPMPVPRGPSVMPPAPAPSAPAIPTVRTAAADRPLADDGRRDEPMLSPGQLAALKEQVYRDLRDRIRVEFERGG